MLIEKYDTLRWFNMIMAKKLSDNNLKYPEGWEDDNIDQLLERALVEYKEAVEEISKYNNSETDPDKIKALKGLMFECADVANVMMMVAERTNYLLEHLYNQDTFKLIFVPSESDTYYD